MFVIDPYRHLDCLIAEECIFLLIISTCLARVFQLLMCFSRVCHSIKIGGVERGREVYVIEDEGQYYTDETTSDNVGRVVPGHVEAADTDEVKHLIDFNVYLKQRLTNDLPIVR